MKDERTEALKQFNDTQSKIVAEYVRKSNIAELEKVKENIQFLAEKCLPNSLAEEFEVKGLKTSIEIIDFHIAKLKDVEHD